VGKPASLARGLLGLAKAQHQDKRERMLEQRANQEICALGWVAPVILPHQRNALA